MRLPRPFAVALAVVLGVGALSLVTPPSTAVPIADRDAWSPLPQFSLRADDARVSPSNFAASRVNLSTLKAQLADTDSGKAVVAIPDPSGTLTKFEVQRTEVMEAELAAAHPEIATYAGHGVDEAGATISLDITPMGVHAAVRSPGLQRGWYLDPAYNQRGATQYLSYLGASLPAPDRKVMEGQIKSINSAITGREAPKRQPGAAVIRRDYRLALVSDPSYARYFGAENVLAEKVTLINRVNQIYNDDFAANLKLVNGTELLNFDTDEEATGVNGPCGAEPCYRPAQGEVPADLGGCSGALLGRNRHVLGQLIGASNYDVGHIALGLNGGGVAYLGVIGGDYKGGGCTGLPAPRGDYFAIDYVAHEIGHQFNGTHTFNGTQHNCSGHNRSSEGSVEPGSGSSVMAYAGICRQDNLQDHTDPYFSQKSTEQYLSLAEGPAYANIEVQTVSLRGFDANGDSIQIGYPGAAGVPVTFENYTTASVEAAVEQATGQDVSVVPWGFDEFNDDNPAAPITTGGFQVIFNSFPTVNGADDSDANLPSLTVSSPSAGVSGFVGETARGGPSNAEGVTQVPVTNNNPVVTAPADRTIPIRTPFALTGSAVDGNGDALTLLWEQNDIGGVDGTALVDNIKANGALFRVFGSAALVNADDASQSPSPGQNIADNNPTRVFPDMVQILAGNTNAATGACPEVTEPWPTRATPEQLECFSEFLPTADYVGTDHPASTSLNFRLTARDGYPTGGGSAFDDVSLRLDRSAGPFLITSHAAPGAVLPGGTPSTVNWAVNNTQHLAANVKVTLSTDGGATFDQVLAESTPNDGSADVTLPNVDAADARLKIEAVDNYFFDVNDASFSIARTTPGLAPETIFKKGPAKQIVLTKMATLKFASNVAGATFQCTVDTIAVDCPNGVVKVPARAGTHEVTAAAVTASGVDATPQVRKYFVPINDRKLKAKGDWQRLKNRKAFRKTFSMSRSRAATLSHRVRGAKRIVLVVTRAPGSGKVQVSLGKKVLGTVNLDGTKKTKVLRSMKVTGRASGRLTIRVLGAKPVRIEGVAVV